jgi:hypothetical protein
VFSSPPPQGGGGAEVEEARLRSRSCGVWATINSRLLHGGAAARRRQKSEWRGSMSDERQAGDGRVGRPQKRGKEGGLNQTEARLRRFSAERACLAKRGRKRNDERMPPPLLLDLDQVIFALALVALLLVERKWGLGSHRYLIPLSFFFTGRSIRRTPCVLEKAIEASQPWGYISELKSKPVVVRGSSSCWETHRGGGALAREFELRSVARHNQAQHNAADASSKQHSSSHSVTAPPTAAAASPSKKVSCPNAETL